MSRMDRMDNVRSPYSPCQIRGNDGIVPLSSIVNRSVAGPYSLSSSTDKNSSNNSRCGYSEHQRK